jgi:PAS domain S-box-containing protein
MDGPENTPSWFDPAELSLTRSIVERLPLGMWVTDGEDRLRLFNPAMEQVSGVDSASVLGMKLSDFPADTIAHFILRYEDVKKSGTPQSYEVPVVTPQGRSTIQSGWLIPLMEQGAFAGMICTVEDVTEHRRAEQEGQKMARLEALAGLAAGIAHEFNNLLGGIYGYVDLACEDVRVPRAREALQKALSTMERAQALTAKMITFAKGGAPLKRVAPIAPILERIADDVRSQSSLAVHVTIADDLWPLAFDARQFDQLLFNIVENAREAMGGRGTLHITASNVVESSVASPLVAAPPEEPKGQFVRICVRDDGPGIEADRLKLVFDPFYSDKPGRSGIGLSVAYSIAKRHGGRLDIESQPGVGTTLSVYLPAEQPSSEERESTSTTEQATSRRALVMDDEEFMRDLSQNILESVGFEVTTVSNGVDAIDAVQKRADSGAPFDLVLLDLTILGGMGGEKTIAEIRKIDPDVPALVMTGYTDSDVLINPQRVWLRRENRQAVSKKRFSRAPREHGPTLTGSRGFSREEWE